MTSTALLLWALAFTGPLRSSAPRTVAPADSRAAAAPGAPVAPAAADTAVRVWVGSVSGPAGGAVVLGVWVAASEGASPVTSIEARVTFDPSVLDVEEILPGEWRGHHHVDADPARRGVLLVRAERTADDGPSSAPVTFLALSARLVGSTGVQSEVRVEVLQAGLDGRPVSADALDVRPGMVRIY